MPGWGDCCAPFRMTHGPARGRRGRALASCNADLARSQITAGNVEGIFVTATEVHPRDLLQTFCVGASSHTAPGPISSRASFSGPSLTRRPT